jgi:hypothetical protein
MENEFQMSIMGELTFFLGIQAPLECSGLWIKLLTGSRSRRHDFAYLALVHGAPVDGHILFL